MSAFTLTNVALFPNSTVVKCYPTANWPTPNLPSGAPIGSSAAEATMTAGTLTFSGLTQGTRYWAVAEVAGVYRYSKFIAGEDVAEADGGGTKEEITVEEDRAKTAEGTLVPKSQLEASGLGHVRCLTKEDLAKARPTGYAKVQWTLALALAGEKPANIAAYDEIERLLE